MDGNEERAWLEYLGLDGIAGTSIEGSCSIDELRAIMILRRGEAIPESLERMLLRTRESRVAKYGSNAKTPVRPGSEAGAGDAGSTDSVGSAGSTGGVENTGSTGIARSTGGTESTGSARSTGSTESTGSVRSAGDTGSTGGSMYTRTDEGSSTVSIRSTSAGIRSPYAGTSRTGEYNTESDDTSYEEEERMTMTRARRRRL